MCSLLAVIVDEACGLGERHLTPAAGGVSSASAAPLVGCIAPPLVLIAPRGEIKRPVR